MDMGSCSGREVYALQVHGDSMAPEFPHGCVVVIDPQGRVQNQSYVIAKINGELFFRQLHMTAHGMSLKALASGYDALPLGGLDAVEGVVIQRASRRRKDRKFYTSGEAELS